MVRSLNGDTNFLDIVAGVLQGDTLAPYLFIICLDYVLWTSKDQIKNGFAQKKVRITLEQAERGIGFYMNRNKCMSHLHSSWQGSKIHEPIQMPRQQHLIYWKQCQHEPNEDVNCYLQVIDLMKMSYFWLN